MKLEKGEIITLSNNKDYIVVSTVSDNNIDYVYLMTTTKPVEVKFGKQIIDNGNIKVSIVNDYDEKQRILNLFQQNA